MYSVSWFENLLFHWVHSEDQAQKYFNTRLLCGFFTNCNRLNYMCSYVTEILCKNVLNNYKMHSVKDYIFIFAPISFSCHFSHIDYSNTVSADIIFSFRDNEAWRKELKVAKDTEVLISGAQTHFLRKHEELSLSISEQCYLMWTPIYQG